MLESQNMKAAVCPIVKELLFGRIPEKQVNQQHNDGWRTSVNGASASRYRYLPLSLCHGRLCIDGQPCERLPWLNILISGPAVHLCIAIGAAEGV